MSEALQERLQQRSFSSPYQEAHLSIVVAADTLQRAIEEVCQGFGITAAQYNVLRILRGVYPEGHARCDIIERMITAAPDVTRLIDRLVKAGLAKRGRSTNDARLSLTFITKKGLRLLEDIEPSITAMDQGLASHITLQEAQTVVRLCGLIIAAGQNAQS